MTTVEIKLSYPTDTVYLTRASIEHMLLNIEKSPFIFKDAKNPENTMTITFSAPQPAENQ